jgi:dTDP-L-rhamnose 4-epimerase
MSIYGEGLYRAPDGSLVSGTERNLQQLKERDWEVRNEQGDVLTPVPTAEWKQPALASVYALSKYDQERLCLMIGRAYGISTVALRFFNIYGTRQALSNPYTGVLRSSLRVISTTSRRSSTKTVSAARFRQRARHRPGVPPRAGSARSRGQVFNVGSGQPYSVRDIAARLARVLNKEEIAPEVTCKYRVGDIRHCYADISLARQVLGYEPQVSLEDGLGELADGSKAKPLSIRWCGQRGIGGSWLDGVVLQQYERVLNGARNAD